MELQEVIHNFLSLGTLEGVPFYLLEKQLSFSCEMWSCGSWEKGKAFISSIFYIYIFRLKFLAEFLNSWWPEGVDFQIDCNMQAHCLYVIVIYGNWNTDGKRFF